MKQEEILNCILHPDRLKEIPFDRLKQALTDYPYSQNLHFLLAQKSMQEQHPDFERHLKTAATYMNSRSFLRKQLQQNDRPSQPTIEPEPESEPAQANSTINVAPEDLMANLPDEELPPVEFIPDEEPQLEEEIAIDENTPNHVADIATDTPPADQPPPSETSAPIENQDQIPPILAEIISPASQLVDLEIAPVKEPLEKKIVLQDEPIAEQPRIIYEAPIVEEAPEEAMVSGSNIPDLSEPEAEEIHGMDLDDEVSEPEEVAPASPKEAPEIIEFPKQFDFEDEMDDLLSKPLIEVVPEKFAKEVEEVDLELEEEDELSDLLLEEFEEMSSLKDLEPISDEELTVQPKLGKWIKKYQAGSEEDKKGKGKKRTKKKDKEEKEASPKAKKKDKKKETSKKTDLKKKKTKKSDKKKESNPKNSKKKKKKDSDKKISKKKAIRKFASRSIVEDGETISITLADLYVKQGKIEKAIVAYERLSLIIPEKKAFFASLIKKLKKK